MGEVEWQEIIPPPQIALPLLRRWFALWTQASRAPQCYATEGGEENP